MLDVASIIAELQEHAAKFDLIERAHEGLAGCFANEGGVIDGTTADEIKAEFHSHRLVFAHTLPPFIETRLTLRSLDGHLRGTYSLMTNFDGEVTDDFLVSK